MQARTSNDFMFWCLILVSFLINGVYCSPTASVSDGTRSDHVATYDHVSKDPSSLHVVTLAPHSNADKSSIYTPLTFHDITHDSLDASASKAHEAGHGDSAGTDSHQEGEHHGVHVFTVDFLRIETPFIIALWIFCASLAKIGFHMTPKLSSIFPESCLLIIVGIVIGLLLFHTVRVSVLPLTPGTFFFYMLPPIILDAGYFMPNRLFFDHLGTILLFAVIGTVWNTITIGLALWACGLSGVYNIELPLLNTFLFSALISAVDPVAVLAVFEEIHVNEVLYIVVFGESLLNDAVTVVLYNMFESYVEIGQENIKYTDILAGFASFLVVALGGTIIGIVWGFLTGFVTRFTNHVRVIEPIFIFVMSYLAYLNAEIFHMSGILAITFCGITMKNYVEGNISSKSHTTIKYAMKMLSSSSETIIFMFLGVNTVHDQHVWNVPFILLTILFCSVFRAVGVIILTELANRFRLHKLNHVEKFVMSYGGLRGAVAFALVLLVDPVKVPQQPLFVTTTICVVYFTVFFQGITIKPLVKFLNVKRANKRELTMNERIHEKLMDYTMAGMEDILGHLGNFKFRDKFKQIDNRYIRPCLIREHKAHEPKILETYSKLTMKDAMDFMKRNGSTLAGGGGSESMAVLFRNYTANNLHSSGSMSQMDHGWNLDIGELEYCPSARDLSDAKIHHLLSEELWKPYRRSLRRLSYSRHAVNDRDLSSHHLNHNTHMNIRRMVSETVRKQHSKRLKRQREGATNGSVSRNPKVVSFETIQENGSSKKLHDEIVHTVIQEVTESEEKEHIEDGAQGLSGSMEDLEEGITFTVRKQSGPNNKKDDDDPDSISYESALATLMRNQQLALAACLTASAVACLPIQQEITPVKTPEMKRANPSSETKTEPATETTKTEKTAIEPVKHQQLKPPQTRFRSKSASQVPGQGLDAVFDTKHRLRFVLEKEPCKRIDSIGESHPSTPTALEMQLPWKRDDENDVCTFPVKQREFPPWVDNKEYTNYNSPTNTFLGSLDKKKPAHPSVIGLFKRESLKKENSDEEPTASASPSFVVTLTIPEESTQGTIDPNSHV